LNTERHCLDQSWGTTHLEADFILHDIDYLFSVFNFKHN